MSKAKLPDWLPTQESMEENIKDVLDQASIQEDYQGCTWYQNAYDIAHELAQTYHLQIGASVGVLSALSPRNKWGRNIMDAFEICDYGPQAVVATFGDGKRKALRILNGEQPLDVLGGFKVRNFYRCILSQGYHRTAVCVDTHALSVALGRRCTAKEYAAMACSSLAYEAVSEAYRKVAKEEHIAPSQLQAITWIVWRNQP